MLFKTNKQQINKTGSGSCFSQGNGVICGFSAFGCAASTGSRATSADELFTSVVLVSYAGERSAPNDCCELLFSSTKCGVGNIYAVSSFVFRPSQMATPSSSPVMCAGVTVRKAILAT